MESGLLITNIKSTIDEKTIRSGFEEFGKILYFNLLTDKFNGKTKVCYLNYGSSEEAMKALQKYDKSMIYGEPLRISFKKIVSSSERAPINGHQSAPVPRNPSFGRGRGMAGDMIKSSRGAPTGSPIVLRTLDIPLNTKTPVEIIELTDLNAILARPILLTESSKSHLTEILGAVNENVNTLVDVRVPEIGGYYLAKWTEDNNFYRAKLLEKSGNNSYKVCFVDEGTSGDIVNELREIPKEISDFPCQFISCTMDCEDSPELMNLIKVSGIDSSVSVYVTSSDFADGKYQINFFVGDEDVIDIYKRQNRKDPRVGHKLSNISDLRRHSTKSEFTDFKIISYPRQLRDSFKIQIRSDVSLDHRRLLPLSHSPINGDLLVYRQSDSCWHRCVVETVKFSCGKDSYRLLYGVRLLDEDRCVETTADSLLRISTDALSPPQLIDCVLDLDTDNQLPQSTDKITQVNIRNFDEKKNCYVVSLVYYCPPVQQTPVIANNIGTSSSTGLKINIGETVNVFASHIESPNEVYIRLADKDSNAGLDQLQCQINECKSLAAVCTKVSSIHKLQLGQIVVAPFADANYRARISDIDINKNMIRVFFIDYGNSESMRFDAVLELSDRSDLYSMPAFAWRCRLPVTMKSGTMPEAVSDLLMGSEYGDQGEVEMTMKVLSLSGSGDAIVVDFYSSGSRDSFVDALVGRGLADKIDISKDAPAGDIWARLEKLETRVARLERISAISSR